MLKRKVVAVFLVCLTSSLSQSAELDSSIVNGALKTYQSLLKKLEANKTQTNETRIQRAFLNKRVSVSALKAEVSTSFAIPQDQASYLQAFNLFMSWLSTTQSLKQNLDDRQDDLASLK